ncbi:MAG: hypothetical protein IKV26_09475 [Paludibacteraceae bacterium]|nr:hypothetical protein [Paludibacteraceae bacterium]
MKKVLFFFVVCVMIGMSFASCEKLDAEKCWEVDAISKLIIQGELLTSQGAFIYLWCKESEIDAKMEEIRLEQLRASEKESGMSFEANGIKIVFEYTYKEALETTPEACEELND